MCSADLREFIEKYHLDLSQDGSVESARDAFGSHDDADHVYNTAKSLVYASVTLNPRTLGSGMVRMRITLRSRMICPGAWCRRRRSRWRM